MLLGVIVSAGIGFGVAVTCSLFASRRKASILVSAARKQGQRDLATAKREAAAVLKKAENAAREDVLAIRRRATRSLNRTHKRITGWESDLKDRQDAVDLKNEQLRTEIDEIDQDYALVQSRKDTARNLRKTARKIHDKLVVLLEEKTNIAKSRVVDKISKQWIEDVESASVQRLRALDQLATDPKTEQEAKRKMSIAASRYQNHFLTEKNRATIRVGRAVCDALVASDGLIHHNLQQVANITLHINDDGDAVRLEGLDGVGREVARRALNKLQKRPSERKTAGAGPEDWAQRIRKNLENEIRALGKKAFSVLRISKAHPEIVELVGALNYRTSYTQNQWLHAVEASFLCGMMAQEMGLDIRIARRATLMHDIGKALTHKMEGSHAVIGADIARRLGEDEVVANAIGAHHAEEPANSHYAYLVAASDAMSGARPGARREMSEGFSSRVRDLEQLAAHKRGVHHAHAVHGGRELRVYVENRLTDLDVVELSTDIATQVSDELTFPGQVKVTVIRSFEAVSSAN